MASSLHPGHSPRLADVQVMGALQARTGDGDRLPSQPCSNFISTCSSSMPVASMTRTATGHRRPTSGRIITASKQAPGAVHRSHLSYPSRAPASSDPPVSGAASQLCLARLSTAQACPVHEPSQPPSLVCRSSSFLLLCTWQSLARPGRRAFRCFAACLTT